MSEDKKPAKTSTPSGNAGQTASGFTGAQVGQAQNNLCVGMLKTCKDPHKASSQEEDEKLCKELADLRRTNALRVRALAEKSKQGDLPISKEDFSAACNAIKAFDDKVAGLREKYDAAGQTRPDCIMGNEPPSRGSASQLTLNRLSIRRDIADHGLSAGIAGRATFGQIYTATFGGNATIDAIQPSAPQTPLAGLLSLPQLQVGGISLSLGRRGRGRTSKNSTATKPTTTKPAAKPASKPKQNQQQGGQAKAKKEPKADPNCQSCPKASGTKPVNPVYGTKVLEEEQDLDFVLGGPLPLAWQRTYVSSNAETGWLGQGWTLPIAFHLDIEDDATVFVDAQGRRTPFLVLEIGEEQFSPYEHTTLKRHARNEYELLTPDRTRLIFGPVGADASQEQAGDQDAPQISRLMLRAIADINGNRVEIYWHPNGQPGIVVGSDGRRVGLRFEGERLAQVLDIIGPPDSQNRYPPSSLATLITYRYSEEGDLIAVVDADDKTVRTFAYRQHMMVEHAEPDGIVSHYEWDQYTPKGRVLRNRLSTGESWTFVYDDVAMQTRVTDMGGRRTIYHFDAERNFTGLTDAEGRHTQRQLDLYGNLAALVDPAGNVTRYGYDLHGNLTRLTQSDGAVTEIRYDPQWNKPVSITDAQGGATEYAYDERGNLMWEIGPDGAMTEFRYNTQGQPVEIVDPRGGIVRLVYDSAGRLASHTDCSGNTTRYAYDRQGNLLHVTDAIGARIEYTYQRINRRDRLVAIKQPATDLERFGYDPLGRLIAHQDANGHVTRYQLDPAGRPTQRIDALGHHLRYDYDLHGRLIALHNENRATTRFAYDSGDRLIAEQGFDGKRISYRYDAAGNLIESIDGPDTATPIRTRYRRDRAGRLLAKIALQRRNDPLSPGQSRFVSARNRYVYDRLGQLTHARNPSARIDLHYHPSGQLHKEATTTADGREYTLEHHYDRLGKRIQTILPDGRKLNLLTYGSGHVHQINLDGQLISDIERDAAHREIRRSQGALETRYIKDSLGRLIGSQTGIAGQSDPFHPANNTAPGPNGARIARRYEYDAAGQLEQLLDNRHGTTRYRYDPIGRLLAAQQPALTETFAFDPAHNLLDKEQAQQANRPKKTSFTQEEWAALVKANMGNPRFNPLQALDDYNNDPATWGKAKANQIAVHEDKRYAYDEHGNTIEKKIGAHTVQQYQWDAEQQLTQVTVTRNGSTQVFQYQYDPFGRRIAKQDAFGTTHFTWDGNRILLEQRGQQQRLYVYEPDSFIPLAQVNLSQISELPEAYEYIPQVPVAWIGMMGMYPPEWKRRMKMEGLTPQQLWQEEEDRRRAEQRKSEEAREAARKQAKLSVYYYHTDHLGTPRELTDSQGNIRWSATYKAWGNTLKMEWVEEADAQAAPVEQAIRFQGQWYDAETGLHYNRFRYYDPDIGRFISQDPIGLMGGANLYQYAPNPVAWIDPKGLSAACDPYVYRVLADDEDPLNGLFAKNPDANYTAEGHVLHGSKIKTQFISASKTLDAAIANRARYGHAGQKIVKIDTRKVAGIIDLNADCSPLKGKTAKNRAKKSQEVLLLGPIPASAVSIIPGV